MAPASAAAIAAKGARTSRASATLCRATRPRRARCGVRKRAPE